MATINMPSKKQNEGNEDVRPGQGRRVLERFRLQVDRQMKYSFTDKTEAIKRGKAIKKAYPVVQVSIYDADENETVIIEA